MLPKQLQSNFEKVQKTTLSTSKIVNYPQGVKLWPKISIWGVIYQRLELKIHTKVGLSMPKTSLKQILNN